MTAAVNPVATPTVATREHTLRHPVDHRPAQPIGDALNRLHDTITALETAEHHVKDTGLALLFHDLTDIRRRIVGEVLRAVTIDGNGALAKSHGTRWATARSAMLKAQTYLLGDDALLRYLIMTELKTFDRLADTLAEEDLPADTRSALALAAEGLRVSVSYLERELI